MHPFKNIADNICQNLTQSPELGRVLFLAGNWGVGKTYFWNHYIEPEIKKKASIVLYLSVFGVSNHQKLAQKINTLYWQTQVRTHIKKAARKSENNEVEAFKNFNLAIRRDLALDPANLDLDFTEFWESGCVLCVDDVERLSTSYPLAEFLGFMNVLAEQKKFKILLVADEAKLFEHRRADSEFYKIYKEKIISHTYLINSDTSNFYDSFTERIAHSAALKKKLRQHKDLITTLFNQHEISNLRIMQKVLWGLREVLSIPNLLLKPAHLVQLTSFIIENERGVLREFDFYNFHSSHFKIFVKNQWSDSLRNAHYYYIRYFPNNEEYHFVPAFYHYVKNGFLNAEQLVKELDVFEGSGRDEKSVIFNLPRTHWQEFDEKQISSLLLKINQFILSDDTFNTYQTFVLALFAQHFSRILEIPFSTVISEAITSRLKNNAQLLDKSFGWEQQQSLRAFHEYYQGLRDQYQEWLDQAILQNLKNDIETAVRQQNFKELEFLISNNPKALLAIFETDLWNFIKYSQKVSLSGFEKTIALVINELTKRYQAQLPRLNFFKTTVHSYLNELLNGQVNDKMAALRLRHLLGELGIEDAGLHNTLPDLHL